VGLGGWAIVYKINNQLVAKAIKKHKLSDSCTLAQIKNEINAMRRLNYKRIDSIIEVNEDDQYIYLIIENVGQISLRNLIESRDKL
jgi:serine/threonine protein kinase